METKNYVPTNNGFIGGTDAKKCGLYIEKLIKKNKGAITPQIIVNDARDKKSPLHKYFEWDDGEASEKWREYQARSLLRSISVEIQDSSGETSKVRSFYCVSNTDSPQINSSNVYVSLNTIMTDTDKRAEVINYALGELAGWKRRYKNYSELGDIVKFLDEKEID